MTAEGCEALSFRGKDKDEDEEPDEEEDDGDEVDDDDDDAAGGDHPTLHHTTPQHTTPHHTTPECFSNIRPPECYFSQFLYSYIFLVITDCF